MKQKESIRKRIAAWLVRKICPGYHIRRTPEGRARKEKVWHAAD